jgi:transposase
MFYVGLDVSVARTAVCIMDAAGQVLLERSVESTPETITATIRASGKDVERVGLEAGINSAWIARGLVEAKLPVIVIDATHAAAALNRLLKS